MAIPIIPALATTVVIGRKIQKTEKVAQIVKNTWPLLGNIATKSISAIARVLNRMSILLREECSASAIWHAARTAIDESVRVNPQFVTQVLGTNMSKESAINFFAKLFELLI